MTTFAASYPPRRKTSRNLVSAAPSAANTRDTVRDGPTSAWAAPTRASVSTVRRCMATSVSAASSRRGEQHGVPFLLGRRPPECLARPGAQGRLDGLVEEPVVQHRKRDARTQLIVLRIEEPRAARADGPGDLESPHELA